MIETPAPHPDGTGTAEMTLAGQVQNLLFPKSSPVCSWCCMGVKNEMASVLGGDFYDFIELEDGCQAVFVGDVTGHGLHASVVMSLVYGYLHRAGRSRCEPLKTVVELNAFLRSFARRTQQLDHFFSATLFFGVIHPPSLVMHYVNAGHPAGLIRRGPDLFDLEATGHPLGYFDQPELRMREVQLQSEDRLLLYTDGLIDGLGPAGDVFGLPRLKVSCLQTDGDHLEFLKQLFARVSGHQSGQPQTDDRTAIVIDFHAPSGAEGR